MGQGLQKIRQKQRKVKNKSREAELCFHSLNTIVQEKRKKEGDKEKSETKSEEGKVKTKSEKGK